MATAARAAWVSCPHHTAVHTGPPGPARTSLDRTCYVFAYFSFKSHPGNWQTSTVKGSKYAVLPGRSGVSSGRMCSPPAQSFFPLPLLSPPQPILISLLLLFSHSFLNKQRIGRWGRNKSHTRVNIIEQSTFM